MDGGVIVSLCERCVLRATGSTLRSAASMLIASVGLTLLFSALTVVVISGGTVPSGFDASALDDLSGTSPSERSAVLAVVAALMIAITLTIGQISARIQRSRMGLEAGTTRVVDLEIARSLELDQWSLIGEFVLAHLCTAISATVAAASLLAPGGSADRFLALVAGTLAVWGAFEVSRCAISRSEANQLSRARNRVTRRIVEQRAQSIASRTTESTRYAVELIWWTFLLGAYPVTSMFVGTLPGPWTTLMLVVVTAIFGGAIRWSTGVFVRESLFETGAQRVLYLGLATFLVTGLSLVVMVNVGTQFLTENAGPIAEGSITATLAAHTVMSVSAALGSGGVGWMRSVARPFLPLEPDRETQLLDAEWRETRRRTRVIWLLSLLAWIATTSAVGYVWADGPRDLDRLASGVASVVIMTAACTAAALALGWTARHSDEFFRWLLLAIAVLVVTAPVIISLAASPHAVLESAWVMAVSGGATAIAVMTARPRSPRVSAAWWTDFPARLIAHVHAARIVKVETRLRDMPAAQSLTATRGCRTRGCGRASLPDAFGYL